MAFLLDGQPLAVDTPFVSGGIQYPANWLRLSSAEEKAAIGITEAPDPAPYDQRFAWGWADDGSLIWKDHADLLAQWQQQTSQTAGSLLAPTDWYVVREADTGLATPAEIRSWRQAIRAAAASKQEALAATASAEELQSLVIGSEYNSWPECPEALAQEVAPDYRSFYDALLISPAYAAIRTKAVASPAVLTACVEFIAAIGDAKAGRANPPAIQACVDLLCAAGQFSAPELLALAEVMAVGGLDQVYTLPAD